MNTKKIISDTPLFRVACYSQTGNNLVVRINAAAWNLLKAHAELLAVAPYEASVHENADGSLAVLLHPGRGKCHFGKPDRHGRRSIFFSWGLVERATFKYNEDELMFGLTEAVNYEIMPATGVIVIQLPQDTNAKKAYNGRTVEPGATHEMVQRPAEPVEEELDDDSEIVEVDPAAEQEEILQSFIGNATPISIEPVPVEAEGIDYETALDDMSAELNWIRRVMLALGNLDGIVKERPGAVSFHIDGEGALRAALNIKAGGLSCT